MPRALCGARGSPRRRQPPPRQAGPGALINYLIFPLCLIYSPARLWPYAAFVVSGSLLWQAALAAQTPPPAFDPPTPPTPSSPATPQAPWRAPPGLGGVRGGGGTAGRGHIAFFFSPFLINFPASPPPLPRPPHFPSLSPGSPRQLQICVHAAVPPPRSAAITGSPLVPSGCATQVGDTQVAHGPTEGCGGGSTPPAWASVGEGCAPPISSPGLVACPSVCLGTWIWGGGAWQRGSLWYPELL